MPNVTPRDLRIDQFLTNISIGYRNLTYIADTVAPIVEVNNQSGLIPRYKRSHWFRDEAKPRAMGTRSEGGGWDVDSSLNYWCPRFSYRDEIPDELRDNNPDTYNLENTSVEFVVDKLQLRRERALSANLFASGKGWTDKVGGTDFTQWSDLQNSSPLVDMVTFNDTVELAIGREGNTLLIGKPVWNVLRWHPDLIEVVKNVERGVVTEQLVRDLFGIDRLLIGRAIYTSDPEGTAESSVTYQRIWGKSGLLLYLTPRPALNAPAAMYTLVWNRVPNAIQYMKRMRDEEREIDIIEGNSYFTHVLTSGAAGMFLGTAVA